MHADKNVLQFDLNHHILRSSFIFIFASILLYFMVLLESAAVELYCPYIM